MVFKIVKINPFVPHFADNSTCATQVDFCNPLHTLKTNLRFATK